MTEMYVILGWIGWIWLALSVSFVAGYLKGERDLARRQARRDS
jgi:hypothetical protein